MEHAIRTVADYRGLLPYEVEHMPAALVLSQLRPILRIQWDRLSREVSATEWGVMRALQTALTDKEPKPLPDYDEVTKPKRFKLPAWQVAFEQANADKRIR